MIKFNDNNILGAIFDMDGTMFDTERLRFQTLKQASLEMTGVEFSDGYLMACLGLSAKRAEELAHQQYGQEIPYAEIRKRADQLELESVRQNGVPIKFGLLQVLERLRKSKLKMAVATSSRREIAEEYLINAGVYKFFDVVVCGDDVTKGKPDPDIFLKAAKQLNLAAADCLMLEDSENGLTSAYRAGGVTVLLQDIKAPTSEMLDKAQYFYLDMQAFLTDLERFTPRLEMPSLEDGFPQTLNQHVVGIHGFGAIGGGYLAQVLSHWDGYTRPRQIYASTRNALYRSAVNSFAGYNIRYGQHSHDERIDCVTMLDANNIGHMQTMYIESSLIAICLPEQALSAEAHTIAQGLYARYLQDQVQNKALTILVVLNKIGAKALLIKQVKHALCQITDEPTAEKILAQHYFCDTVVNRMVAKISDQKLFRQLRIKYNIFKQTQNEFESDTADLDEGTHLNPEQEKLASQYMNELSQHLRPTQILQHRDLILFHAESDMPIYVENHSPLLAKMRQMILVDDIHDIQLIKNRLWNGVHAMTAWAGCLMGYQTIGVALSDPAVAQFMQQLLHEVKLGLKDLYPNRQQNLEQLSHSFQLSCETAYQDPCVRVARDPYRKLSYAERVLSSVLYNYQRNKPYEYLLKGLSVGYLYAMQTAQQDFAALRQYARLQLAKSNLTAAQQQNLWLEMEEHLMELIELQNTEAPFKPALAQYLKAQRQSVLE